ncbi:hypothetical protein ABH968_000460, partial [Lysinibacillus sp. RC79]
MVNETKFWTSNMMPAKQFELIKFLFMESLILAQDE